MRLVAIEETRRSWPAPWARRLAVLAFAVLVVGLVAHWFGLLETRAFFWTMGLAAAMAVAALLLVALAMPKVWHLGYRGGSHLVVASLFATLVLAPFALAGFWIAAHPALTDISTDLDDPPAFDHAARLRTPDMTPLQSAGEEWKAEQTEAWPKVGGRRYDIPIESVREAAEKVFDQRGWTQLGPYIVGTGTEFTLETTVHSLALALPSDIVVRLIGDDEATLVDMRAASRYGEADFGANAELIMAFMNDLDTAVASLTRVAPSE